MVPAGNSDIYAQRLNSSGSQLWAAAGVVVCSATNHQFRPQIVSDGAGGAIMAWYDLRSATADIYAQRLNSSGNPLWTPNGVLVSGASGTQNAQHMIPDGAGGTIICWTDTRAGDYDIYAQRLNSSGAAQWASNGAYVCTASGSQNSSALVTDGAGGAIISWEDNRGTSSDIYAQRVSSSGTPLWTIDGVIVNACAGAQTAVDITTDGSNGAIVTWQDHRGTVSSDIYAQRLSASGNILWETDGNVVCTSDNDETRPVVTYSASGQAIIAWNSFNVTTSDDIYALSTYYTVSVPDWPPEVAPSPAISLDQNFPNPFNPITHITFVLAAPGEVSLRIYDIAGRMLRTLVNGWREPGVYSEMWNGRSDGGTALPSGVYFYRLKAGEFAVTRKLVLLR